MATCMLYIILFFASIAMDRMEGQPTVENCYRSTCPRSDLQEQVLRQAEIIRQQAETIRQIQEALSVLTDHVKPTALLSSSLVYVHDNSFTASSQYSNSEQINFPRCARIYSTRLPPYNCGRHFFWRPAQGKNPSYSWWQVELSKGSLYEITSVETQGHWASYISQYQISYIEDRDLIPYLDNDKNRKVFTVNSIEPTLKKLSPPIEARVVRIKVVRCAPQNNWEHCKLKVELYGKKLN